jgi:hypothetical protein
MKRLAYLMIIAVIAGSCKNELIDNPSQYSVIYMPQAIDYPAVRTTIMTDSLQSIIVGAAYGGIDNLSRNVHIQLSIDPSLADEFNSKNGTSYPVMPAGSYQLQTTETDILPGTTSSTPVKLSIKTVGGIEPDKDYLLPVRIHLADEELPVNEKLRTTYFLIRAEYQEFNRTGWNLLEVSSQEAPNIGANVLDGNFTTQWHTQWKNAKPPHPHFVKVDMNQTKTVHGFYFWPSNVATGNPQKVHVDVSADGTTWTSTGTYTFENTYKKFPFYFNTPVQARYFKFVIDSSFVNTHFTHLQEIGAF